MSQGNGFGPPPPGGPPYGGPPQGTGPTAPVPPPTGPGTAATAPIGAAGTGRRKKSKAPLFVSLGAVVLVLVLVIAGFVVVNRVNQQNYGPDTAAQEYLDAMTAGDWETVDSIAAPEVPEGASDALVDPAFLQDSEAPVTSAQIVGIEESGDTAVVDTTYVVDGQEYSLPITVVKEGRTGLFFDKWTVQPPQLPTLAMDLPFSEGLTVNGQEFTPPEDATTYAVLPGRYDVVAPGAKYYKESDDTVTLGFPTSTVPQEGAIELSVQATDDFQSDVQAAVEKKIRQCAKNNEVLNPGCPFNFDTEDEAQGIKTVDDVPDGTVKYSIDKQPTVVAELGSDLTSGSFYTNRNNRGEVSITADSEEAGSGAWEGSMIFPAEGTVTIDGDELSVTLSEEESV
ncbi:nuclear transport factor 2 family protein [Brevibacterium litoralis]|uniref:nuclear transport factor 2 family protein n=1 Tax=Brevibacterium litoralis TaxID=3138935 RepID=UPI0032EB317C